MHELAAVAGPAAVEDGLEAGVLRLDGRRVRAAHPLLAAAARSARDRASGASCTARSRGAVDDAQLRALHLALATESRTPSSPRHVAAAAEAPPRAARATAAVELAEHALRLTPADAPERHERLLALAAYLETAGELQRLTDLLEPAIRVAPGRAAAGARLAAAGRGRGPRTIDELDRHLELALAESGRLRGVRALRAGQEGRAGRGEPRRAHRATPRRGRSQALPAAARAGGDVRAARAVRARLGPRAGRTPGRRPLRALGAARRRPPTSPIAPERVAGQRLVWRGEIEQARGAARAAAGARRRARRARRPTRCMRLHLCELELRAGEWGAAARLLDEWARVRRSGELLVRPMYQRCRALLAAGRGAGGRGGALGGRRDRARGGDRLALGLARGAARARARRAARPRAGAGGRAASRAVWEHTDARRASTSRARSRSRPIWSRRSSSSASSTRRARSPTGCGRSPSATSTRGGSRRARCARWSLARAASTTRRGLAAAADEYGRLGLRFDRARTLLSLGPRAAAAEAVGRRARVARGRRAPRSTSSAPTAGPSWRARRARPRRRAPAAAERRADADRARVVELAAERAGQQGDRAARCTWPSTPSRCTSRARTPSSACARAPSSPRGWPSARNP